MDESPFEDRAAEVLRVFGPAIVAAIGRKPRAFEAFARDGAFTTRFLAEHCDHIIGCDIDPGFRDGFLRNVPGGTFIAGDSVAVMATGLAGQRFDLISLDAPLGCYGADRCEHFEVLPLALPHLADRAVLLFNVVTTPYAATESPNAAWMARRRRYYGVECPGRIETGFLETFYRTLLEQFGFAVTRVAIACRERHRGVAYLHMMAIDLRRR